MTTYTLDVALKEGNRDNARPGTGATVWITGLPAAGKSTLAGAVHVRLAAEGRAAYVLDGDLVRDGLNGDLGFSAADRAENVRRLSHVARLFADAGLVAIVAAVSPYAADRDDARGVHNAGGLPFLEVFVDTPLEECERRDPKGLYARARAGELADMTGVDDPYEPPRTPGVRITPTAAPDDAASAVVSALDRSGGLYSRDYP